MKKTQIKHVIRHPLLWRGLGRLFPILLWRGLGRLLGLFVLLQFLLPLDAVGQGLPLIRNYAASEYGGHNRNFDIEIGEDGTVFVANFEGLLYYDHVRWHILHTPEINRVTVVYRDSKNTVWVGGYNFFARLQQRENGELYMQEVGDFKSPTTDLKSATTDLKSATTEGGDLKSPATDKGVFWGEVMEIFEDGSLQFVASDNNIYEVKDGVGQSLPTVSLKKHANTNFVSSMESDIVSVEALKEGYEEVLLEDITQTEELDGGLQVKVKKNYGLIIVDGEGRELYTITEANGLCSNQVAYVAYDGHGTLWGATSHGIFAIELPSVYSYVLSKDGLAGEVHAITAFDGKIYVGGTSGVYVIAGQTCKPISEINNICWTLCQSRGHLLAATSSGIYQIAPGGNVTRLTSNATTAMLVNGDKVYAGEPDGVYCYQGFVGGKAQAGADAKIRVQKINDLPLVTEMGEDARGDLWFRNVHGEVVGSDSLSARKRDPIETLDPAALLSKELPDSLLRPIDDIEVKALYRHGDQVWIGGDEILAIIDTSRKDLIRLTESRTVRFRSIVMGGDSVLWGGFGQMPKSLPKLSSHDRHLHFYYALDYVPLTGKTLYRYHLNDEKWSAWTDRQDIEFFSLPYGTYTLYVQAQLANGQLSEETSVRFSIDYPLLMRWYMFLLYFILLALLVYGLFRYRLKRLQKDKIKLERIVRERTSEVVRQKDEIVRQKDEIEEKSKSLEKALDDLSNAQHELIRQEKMATVGKLTEGLIDRILNPMNYIINFSKMSNDLLRDLKENINNNKENINEDDYEDTLDVLGMLTDNLRSVNQYGQNTTRILKAMEEMLKDRTGGYVQMDLLPLLYQDEQMLNQFFAKEKEQYHIRTAFNLPPKIPAMPLRGNPDLLSKTIMSLLANAVYAVVKKAEKFGDSKSVGGDLQSVGGDLQSPTTGYVPEISFTVEGDFKSTGTYIMKIRDNGIGIEEKILGKIFDPFFTTKTTGEAAGVGLYLSREIIQNHGGDISVASVKYEYTEFTITLPVG